MGKSAYIGASNKARKIKTIYIGVGGKARKVKKAWIGVSGKAREFYSGLEYLKMIYGTNIRYDPSGASTSSGEYSVNHGNNFLYFDNPGDIVYIGKLDKWVRFLTRYQQDKMVQRSLDNDITSLEWEDCNTLSYPEGAGSGTFEYRIIDKYCIASVVAENAAWAYVIDIETGQKGPVKAVSEKILFAHTASCDGNNNYICAYDTKVWKFSIDPSTLEISTPTTIAVGKAESTNYYAYSGGYWDGSTFICIVKHRSTSNNVVSDIEIFKNGSLIKTLSNPGGSRSVEPAYVVDDQCLYLIWPHRVGTTSTYQILGYKVPINNPSGSATSFTLTNPADNSNTIHWLSDGAYLYGHFTGNNNPIYRISRMSGSFTMIFTKTYSYTDGLRYTDPYARTTDGSSSSATYQPE